MVRGWWGNLPSKSINEAKVEAAWRKVAELPISNGKKKKRWNIVQRLVGYLAETGRCETPRNLRSKLFLFRAEKKSIRTWPLEVVRQELADLPELYRLFALMGLNAGMTNSDISELTVDMIAGDKLTRRRVKTGDNENVPTVVYKLWPQVTALLNKFKSNHPSLWFTTRGRNGVVGAKLVDHRVDAAGNVKTKDMIQTNWRRVAKGQPIPLAKFRNVAATLLGSHEVYGRFAAYFLAHSPETVADKHYVRPSDELFYKATDWLRDQVFPPQG